MTAVEIDDKECVKLRRICLNGNPNLRVLQEDFLKLSIKELGSFDYIVMNPPYTRGTWAKHLVKAVSHLRPDGQLLAILPDTEQAIMKALDETGIGFSSRLFDSLPEGSFKESGTMVRTGVLRLTKGW